MPPTFPPKNAIFRSNAPTNRICIVHQIIHLCNQGKLKEAINSLPNLASKGIRLNSETFTYILKHCAKTRSLEEGKWVHLHLKLTGIKQPTTLISNYLIHMYFECGDYIEARKVFDKMSVRNSFSWNNAISGYAKLGMLGTARKLFDRMGNRDVVSWNTMVIGYAQAEDCSEAIRLYKEFRKEGIECNAFSFAGVITVGIKLKDLRLARQVHCQVFRAGFTPNVVLSSSILDGYAKCGVMSDARRLFDEMKVNDILVWTALISGYCKWGDMRSAQELFDVMPEKNSVSWTAVISGYARNNLGHDALGLFREMIMFGVTPNQFTFSSSLCACASLASLKHGKQIHAYMIRTNIRPNSVVVSSLIDMYSKSGSLENSRQVFLRTNNKQEVLVWNPMIAALAQHGYGEEAINVFDEMILYRVKPNRVTFVTILTACSHSGLVDQGLTFFKSMSDDHGICPDVEHYACLIDLLGRAGYFDELMKQLEKMPCKDDDMIWSALVGVCRIHDKIELGKQAAEHLIKLNPLSYAPYILLSSIHAALGQWDNSQMMWQLMSQRCAKKEQASSMVGKIATFPR